MLSVVQRYYSVHVATPREVVELKGEDELYVYQHHNGLCLLTLGSGHPIRKRGLRVTRVDFNVGGSDRSKNAVRGKKKKGGLQVHPGTVICKVFTAREPPAKRLRVEVPEPLSEEAPQGVEESPEGDEEWIIRACVKGFLLEPNSSLSRDPRLLEKKVTSSFVDQVAISSQHSLQSQIQRATLPSSCPPGTERTRSRVTFSARNNTRPLKPSQRKLDKPNLSRIPTRH